MLLSNHLAGKTAVVTGSNRGIGKVIVETLAANGASICACARTETPEFIQYLDEVSKKYLVKVRALFFDLSSENEIKNALKVLVNERIKIDILINNAGVAHGAFFQMTSIKTIREIFEVNFFSQMQITQIVSKIMMKNLSGSIVNITSVAGIDAYSGYSAYGSSKAALNFATKTLSKELASYNVRINAVAPGLTETLMATQMEKKAKDIMVGDSAMKRLAHPQEIANMVLFLVSDQSSFITGQILRVDGGM